MQRLRRRIDDGLVTATTVWVGSFLATGLGYLLVGWGPIRFLAFLGPPALVLLLVIAGLTAPVWLMLVISISLTPLKRTPAIGGGDALSQGVGDGGHTAVDGPARGAHARQRWADALLDLALFRPVRRSQHGVALQASGGPQVRQALLGHYVREEAAHTIVTVAFLVLFAGLTYIKLKANYLLFPVALAFAITFSRFLAALARYALIRTLAPQADWSQPTA